MQTECPHCNSVFRIKESQLEQANGQVRCGHCLAIFSADTPYHCFATDTDTDTDTNILAQDDASTNTAAMDEFLFEQGDENIVADVIPPELRTETRKAINPYAFLSTLFLSLAILISIFAGAIQFTYYNRDSLVKIPELRPWLSLLCDQLGCSLAAPKDIKLISLSSKNIFSHPNAEGALMVTASIINKASFAQDYPIIELRFENVRGKTIAARRFYAVEYLSIPQNQISNMQPDVPVNISLEIKDPGKDMVSYEFSFL